MSIFYSFREAIIRGEYTRNVLAESSMIYRINIEKEDIENFIIKNRKIFLYGTGAYARRILYIIKTLGYDVSGIVVSKSTNTLFNGIKVINYSELEDDSSIVVCMNRKKAEELYKKLKNRKNTLWLWKDLNGK